MMDEATKKARAEKAKATRAANKARKEKARKERMEMLESMKRLAMSDKVEDETKARLLIEINIIQNPNAHRDYGSYHNSSLYRAYSAAFNPGIALGMF